MFVEGDLTKPLDKQLSKDIASTVIKRLGKKEGTAVSDEILNVLGKTRQEFNDLLEITAQGPGAKADLPPGVTKDLRRLWVIELRTTSVIPLKYLKCRSWFLSKIQTY